MAGENSKRNEPSMLQGSKPPIQEEAALESLDNDDIEDLPADIRELADKFFTYVNCFPSPKELKQDVKNFNLVANPDNLDPYTSFQTIDKYDYEIELEDHSTVTVSIIEETNLKFGYAFVFIK